MSVIPSPVGGLSPFHCWGEGLSLCNVLSVAGLKAGIGLFSSRVVKVE